MSSTSSENTEELIEHLERGTIREALTCTRNVFPRIHCRRRQRVLTSCFQKLRAWHTISHHSWGMFSYASSFYMMFEIPEWCGLAWIWPLEQTRALWSPVPSWLQTATWMLSLTCVSLPRSGFLKTNFYFWNEKRIASFHWRLEAQE